MESEIAPMCADCRCVGEQSWCREGREGEEMRGRERERDGDRGRVRERGRRRGERKKSSEDTEGRRDFRLASLRGRARENVR